MAEKPDDSKAAEAAGPAEAGGSGEPKTAEKGRSLGRWLGRVFDRPLLGALLIASLAGHLVGYGYHRLSLSMALSAPTAEISLGSFCFQAAPDDRGRVARARFSLHLALLSHVESAARQRLAARKYRVRQSVEQLLRAARSGDFEDPALEGLKARLQQQINQVIDLKAVAEVIITDFRVERAGRSEGTATATARSEPGWWQADSG